MEDTINVIIPKTYEESLKLISQNSLYIGLVPVKHRIKELCLIAMKSDGRALKYVPRKIIDREIVIEAIKNNPKSLTHAPLEMKNDFEIVLEAVKKDGETIRSASKELRNNPFIVYAAISNTPYAFEYVSKSLKEKYGFVFIPFMANLNEYIEENSY